MENIMGVLAGIGLAVILSIGIMAAQKRKRGKAWKAVVTDIRRLQDFDDEQADQDYVVIRYRTDAGKKGKLQLDSFGFAQRYASLEVGDRLIKEPGQDYPRPEPAEGKSGS